MKRGYFEKGKFIEYNFPKPKTTGEMLFELNNRMATLEKNYSNLHFHADVGFRGATEIIVCGVLNGKDYVQKYYIPISETKTVVDILYSMQHGMQRGRMDMPFRGMF